MIGQGKSEEELKKGGGGGGGGKREERERGRSKARQGKAPLLNRRREGGEEMNDSYSYL